MRRDVTEQQMIDIIWGSTLLGGGGGGSITSGTLLLESYKRQHPGVPIVAPMIEVSDMEPDTYASATAGMGAPAAIVGVDFSTYAANASALLKEIVARMPGNKELKYNIPVELGGFSSFFPFLLALQSGGRDPVVDADGAGRAVPALETLLLNVNGCPTCPIALANGDNDRITVELADPYNAPLAEKIGRDICGEFGNMVGISGWLVDKDDINEKICVGTMTLTQQIGEVIRTSNVPDSDLFEELTRQHLVQAKVICKGEVIDITTETSGGFDYGTLTVKSDATGETYCIRFQNENLLLQKKLGETGFLNMMTVPDLTCMYCIDPAGAEGVTPRMPLSNADAKVGMKIAVGVIKADDKWFIDQDNKWWTVWAECMDKIGYTGGYLSYDDVTPQE